eukprot:GHVT01071762.1.p1 GENE.GHVT01071762.1~~GHVT01071762.1.p1  ORF type:complete len:226 (+),score=29.48 GHVT01071762.1:68-745(+)
MPSVSFRQKSSSRVPRDGPRRFSAKPVAPTPPKSFSTLWAGLPLLCVAFGVAGLVLSQQHPLVNTVEKSKNLHLHVAPPPLEDVEAGHLLTAPHTDGATLGASFHVEPEAATEQARDAIVRLRQDLESCREELKPMQMRTSRRLTAFFKTRTAKLRFCARTATLMVGVVIPLMLVVSLYMNSYLTTTYRIMSVGCGCFNWMAVFAVADVVSQNSLRDRSKDATVS